MRTAAEENRFRTGLPVRIRHLVPGLWTMNIDKPSSVRITLGEHLPHHGSAWFDGMNITNLPNGQAILSGVVTDQAALFGILIRIRDLGLRLIALEPGDRENGKSVNRN